MSKLFPRNIGRTGRLIRGLGGLAFIVGGFFLLAQAWWVSALLWVSGAFMVFEALRGWCLMRACGVRTRW